MFANRSAVSFCMTALALVASTASAQQLLNVSLGKERRFQQLDASSVSAADQFGFWVDVEGSPSLNPRVSGPITLQEPNHNGGFLGFTFKGSSGLVSWGYAAPNFNGWSTSTQQQCDQLFQSGNYTVTIGSLVIPLNLSGNLYAAQPPRMTVAGGTWVAPGVCLVEPTDCVLTTSSFAEFGTHTEDAILLGVLDSNGFVVDQASQLASADPLHSSVSLTVPASSLVRGRDYVVYGQFSSLPTIYWGLPGYPNALAYSLFNAVTSMTLRVRSAADLNHDGSVGAPDLAALLSNWGSAGASDLNGDGTTNSADLAVLLSDWS